MKITYKGDYALKIIFDLSLNYEKGMIQIKEIAKRQDIPIKYLEQIIIILKGAGYVRSRRGPSGGIWLAKPPEQIMIGDIVRLMEGSTSPIACVSTSSYSKCDYEESCPFIEIWCKIRDSINSVVDTTSFKDIADKYNKMREKNAFVYTI